MPFGISRSTPAAASLARPLLARIDEVKDWRNARCHLLAPVFPGVTILGDLLALRLPVVTVFYHGLQMLLCIDFYNCKPHMLLRR